MDKRVEIDERGLKWLWLHQPSLLYFDDSGVGCIKGTLHINALFDKDHKELIINPKKEQIDKYANQYVDDSYEISVKFDKPTSYEIATVKEIGGRLADVARRKKLKIIDVHAYEKEGNRLCVHGFFNLNKCLPNGFDLKDYVSNLLIPFFYSQSIFERTGKWPFGEYLHGDYGKFQNLLERQDFPRLSDYLLEEEGRLKNFFDHLTIAYSIFRYRHPCICKSGLRIIDCKCGFREIIGMSYFKLFIKQFRKYFKLTSDQGQKYRIPGFRHPLSQSRYS